MISFIDFLNVKLGNQDEHLTKQVIAMFPTFVDYGFMTKTDNDEYILTNRGNNAFTTLLCGVFLMILYHSGYNYKTLQNRAF